MAKPTRSQEAQKKPFTPLEEAEHEHHELDPVPNRGHVSASVWRSWAENADPELLEEFNGRTLDVLRGVRSNYPPDCGPRHGEYRNMRRECVDALNRLCETVQGEDDALD